MKNLDYIKFIVSKVESEFIGYTNGPEYIKVITVLHALKVSDNILRDIYILSGIKKLRKLSSYLIFMIKKIESGSISLDNFIENYTADKLFICSYFQTYYDLEKTNDEAVVLEETDTKFIFSEDETDSEPPVYKLVDSGFKVEDVDNELVTEEFRESTLIEEFSESSNSYMSLVEENKDKETDENVFFTDSSDDVFNLPLENRESEQMSDTDLDSGESLNQQDSPATILEPEDVEPEKPDEDDNKDIFQEIDERKILQDLIPTIPEITKEEEEESPSERRESDDEVDGKLQEIEKKTSEAIMNSEFANYEKFLLEKNMILFGLFDELTLKTESSDRDPVTTDSIFQEIQSIVEELKEYSEKMSFEVITGIYATLIYCFDIKFKDIIVSNDNFAVFKKSIEGVEDLIKGNDLTGFDTVIAKLNSLRDDLAKLLADRENFEKKKYDFGEEESNVIREFKDSSEYDAFIILREKISELEETFQMIEDMKDKTYPFESIRKLSVTFALFREVVNIARVLEMNKVAHLAEAGYIFVKFVQNYRIDPFKEEVSEVFKYIIYSFKLLYLDKPVKDFDKFLSFLNDPVKIFYPKNNKNE